MSRTFKLLIIVIIIAIFFGLYFGEVSIGDIKIGYFGSKTSDEITYKYRLYNGIEQQSLYLMENQTLQISFES